MVDGAGEGHVLVVLLEGQGSWLVEVGREEALLDGDTGSRRQPLQKLDDVESSEGDADEGWIVCYIDEYMHEDELTQHKEVIEGGTHPEDEGQDPNKESQHGTPPEEIEHIATAIAVVDVGLLDVDVSSDLGVDCLLSQQLVLSVGTSKEDAVLAGYPYLQLRVTVVILSKI